MQVAILGNAGSGKSTLARWLARSADLAVLDLDLVAWEPTPAAVARPLELAEAEVRRFCATHRGWVLEGCYGNLVEAALAFRPLLLFLDPGPERCTAHCVNRPWEPHKYPTRQEQDAALPVLLSWVKDYYTREGPMSRRAHQAIFDRYTGRKLALQRVPVLDPPDAELAAWLR